MIPAILWPDITGAVLGIGLGAYLVALWWAGR